jgi:uncharacterized cupin superfamily protein
MRRCELKRPPGIVTRVRILRSDSAVLGGRQFVTLIFGEEPPGAGARPHTHSREEEAFYVLSGELVIELGEIADVQVR